VVSLPNAESLFTGVPWRENHAAKARNFPKYSDQPKNCSFATIVQQPAKWLAGEEMSDDFLGSLLRATLMPS